MVLDPQLPYQHMAPLCTIILSQVGRAHYPEEKTSQIGQAPLIVQTHRDRQEDTIALLLGDEGCAFK
jgi:hypothetical protein